LPSTPALLPLFSFKKHSSSIGTVINCCKFVRASPLNFLARSAICNSTVDISFIVSGTFHVSKLQSRFKASHWTEPMFSLPYLLAFMGLISQRSIGTMEMIRLPSSFSVSSVPLNSDTTLSASSFFTCLQQDVLSCKLLDFWVRISISIIRYGGDGRLSRVPMQTFCL
jgi:hypothetical protein